MRRFNNSQWTDFVRGVAEPDLDRAMREELESGAGTTEKEAERWRRVAELGRKDSEREVPDTAVWVAEAIGCLQRREAPGTVDSLLKRLVFTVIFDSLSEPAPEPTRGPETSARHLVLEAEKLTVDVRLEREPDRRRPGGLAGVTVDGQILRRNDETLPLPRTPVLVCSGDNVVKSTLTDHSGEFHAGGLPNEHLSLFLLVGREECIEVPLGHWGE